MEYILTIIETKG